jgi:hypothetical protein
MEKHVTIIGVLHIAFGALGIVIAAIVFVAVVGGGILSGDEDAIWITSLVGTAVSGFLLILSIPGIVAGIGVLKYKNWARILMLIIAFLDLLNIPLGTALGAYSIWVLVDERTVKIFEEKKKI